MGFKMMILLACTGWFASGYVVKARRHLRDYSTSKQFKVTYAKYITFRSMRKVKHFFKKKDSKNYTDKKIEKFYCLYLACNKDLYYTLTMLSAYYVGQYDSEIHWAKKTIDSVTGIF